MSIRPDAPRPSGSAFHVVTFNTATNSGPRIAQDRLMAIGPLQKVLAGDPEAPLLALQETGKGLKQRLEAISKRGGPLRIIYQPMTPRSGVMLVIPERFEVEKVDKHRLVRGNLRGCWDTFKSYWRQKRPLGDYFKFVGSFFIPPALTEVVLRDKRTGQSFTVFNTHVSSRGRQTAAQMQQVIDLTRKADTERVLLMGDLNTATADTDRKQDARWAETRRGLEAAGFTDMGPQGADGVSLRSHGINIDYVLAKGFTSLGGRMLHGDALNAGAELPNAEAISDHYAEADTLDFDAGR